MYYCKHTHMQSRTMCGMKAVNPRTLGFQGQQMDQPEDRAAEREVIWQISICILIILPPICSSSDTWNEHESVLMGAFVEVSDFACEIMI